MAYEWGHEGAFPECSLMAHFYAMPAPDIVGLSALPGHLSVFIHMGILGNIQLNRC